MLSLKNTSFFIFFLYNVCFTNAQTAMDSLKNKTFKELKDGFNNLEKSDTLNKVTYANAYLQKAKKNSDTIKIAKGYHFLSRISVKNNITYYDSIINLTKNIKDKTYPIAGYYNKAMILYQKRNFQQSLVNFITVKKN